MIRDLGLQCSWGMRSPTGAFVYACVPNGNHLQLVLYFIGDQWSRSLYWNRTQRTIFCNHCVEWKEIHACAFSEWSETPEQCDFYAAPKRNFLIHDFVVLTRIQDAETSTATNVCSSRRRERPLFYECLSLEIPIRLKNSIGDISFE